MTQFPLNQSALPLRRHVTIHASLALSTALCVGFVALGILQQEVKPVLADGFCGDGIVPDGGVEQCDDANPTNGDGCDTSCRRELGYNCSTFPPSPSTCWASCGDGVVANIEACDDGNPNNGDGCETYYCTVTSGYECSGSPSSCHTVCGDGLQAGSEFCDDGNLSDGDGCYASCNVEAGWVCSGSGPGSCVVACGNGSMEYDEQCDDGNTENGDGCSASCAIQEAWVCSGAPSVCEVACGNGSINAGETCDDLNTADGDGCSASCSAVEFGYTCDYGYPNICTTTCGDGMAAGAEACDDGNLISGDGCNASCAVEANYYCSNNPSACFFFGHEAAPDETSNANGVGGGGSRGGNSENPPDTSGRTANGVKSAETEIAPVTGNASKEQWYTPALRDLQQDLNTTQHTTTQVTLVPAALPSRKEIDALLAGIDWKECDDERVMHEAARKEKRIAALTPDEERRRIALDLRLNRISTRGAVMKRIAELLCLPMDFGTTPFKDLDPNSPYAPAIRALTRKELITGYLDDNGKKLDRIGAEDPITAAEIAILMSRLQNGIR